ncbi:hypothetical protein [Burkholderia sp.]|uniref:hypothetical protein n=1 Tax=Burkholderia sp. TaxID=36773 RepID=UPI0025BED319|nr:hypothetical protein [Burkholderia sp.]MBS6360029.1 hypothetical protein [Burkholderia sp.]
MAPPHGGSLAECREASFRGAVIDPTGNARIVTLTPTLTKSLRKAGRSFQSRHRTPHTILGLRISKRDPFNARPISAIPAAFRYTRLVAHTTRGRDGSGVTLTHPDALSKHSWSIST